MGVWQGRLSDAEFTNDIHEADDMRKESADATQRMAALMGVTVPQSREEHLTAQLTETRDELRKARARLEWIEGEVQRKEDLWQVNSTQRAKFMLRDIARSHGVGTAEIVGERRHQHVVKARHALMWEMCKHLTWSMPRVGRFLGDRDHTTVLHAKRRVEAAIRAGHYQPVVWPWLEVSK